MVDVAGKRNHGEEKEEPNKQFQVYTYYTYRVSVIQNYSTFVAYCWLIIGKLKASIFPPPWKLTGICLLFLVGGGGEFESCQGEFGNLNHWNTQGILR